MKCFAEPFRLDRNRNRGGLMIYIGDDTPRRLLLKHAFPSDIEGLYIELNFKKCKWLLLGTYYPPSHSLTSTILIALISNWIHIAIMKKFY